MVFLQYKLRQIRGELDDNAHNILATKPKRNKPLQRPRHKREDNIKNNNNKETGWEDVNQILLAHNGG